MFAVSSPLRRVSSPILLALAATALIGLVGCGEEEVVDPYMSASLEAVMAGADSVRSPEFKFEIDAPEIDYAKGDVAIVRKGNQMHFLVGPDLENNYASYAGSRLRVQKRFEHGVPTTHLFLRAVRRGEMITPVDSVQSYMLPAIIQLTQQQLQTPGKNLNELSARRLTTFQELMPQNDGDPLVQVQTLIENFVYLPRHDLTPEQAANPGPNDYAWYVILDGCSLQVTNLHPGAQYMLELLKAKNLPLFGSFSLVAVPEKMTDRTRSYGDLKDLSGTIQINWFKFANTAVRAAI